MRKALRRLYCRMFGHDWTVVTPTTVYPPTWKCSHCKRHEVRRLGSDEVGVWYTRE